MSRCHQAGRPIARSLRQAQGVSNLAGPSITARRFSGTPRRQDEVTTTTTTTTDTATSPAPPAAVATLNTSNFDSQPFQCFQEAMKILKADREDKLQQISSEKAKIERLEAANSGQFRGGEAYKQRRLRSLRDHVQDLMVLADINNAKVKMRFEYGQGDMRKPIYRHLAKERWNSYSRKLIEQRISQFHIVPDILPALKPTMNVELRFRSYIVPPGETIPSIMSESAPTLRIQIFEPGERLYTVVVMDSDVPDLEKDAFSKRCHYMAANIPLSETSTLVQLGGPEMEGKLAVPWLPAFSQKGAPYHRLSIFILQQPEGKEPLKVEDLSKLYEQRDGFSLKSFRDKFELHPVGFNMFRTVWDEGTAKVMERAGIPGADIEFKNKRVYSLKEPQKAKGWEAKRQGPKFRHLWKYTHRIATPKRKFIR